MDRRKSVQGMEEYGAQMAGECWDISGANLAAGVNGNLARKRALVDEGTS